MTRVLLLTFSFISVLGLFAQEDILGTYLPVVNTEIKQVWNRYPNSVSNPNVLPVPTYSTDNNNQAQYWDYSNSFPIGATIDTFSLVTYAPDNALIKNLAGQPISHYYPDATLASFVESPFDDADSIWSFYKVDLNGMYNLGHFALKGPLGNPNIIFEDTTMRMTDTELVIPFIVRYGSAFSDTSVLETYFTYNLNGTHYPAKYIKTTKFSYHINGHGTLATPAGVFNNVLLGTGFVEKHDSLLIEFTPQVYTHVPNSSIPGLSDYSAGTRHYFLANTTFATSVLMQINTTFPSNAVHYGWYTLPSKVGSIEGVIYEVDGVTPVSSGKVLLYREKGNFRKNDVLQSVNIGAGGTYSFTDIPYGRYLLLARPDSNLYPTAYSTYYEEFPNAQDSLRGITWDSCDLVITTADTAGIDIVIRTNNFTPSVIANQLTGELLGYTVTKNLGNDPIKGIDIIILKDPSSQPIVSTQTDSTGRFMLYNLQDGNYKIWVDIPGLDLTSGATYHFEIRNGQYNRCEFDFTADLDTVNRTGQDVDCAWSIVLTQENEKELITIMPNPFQESTQVNLYLKEKKKVSLSVYDITGKFVQNIVFNENLIGNNTFDVSSLKSSGIYFIKGQIGDDLVTKRIVKL